MRKLSYLSVLLFVSLFSVVTFIIPIETKAQSIVYKTYYLSTNETDSAFIKKNKIEFYKTQQKKEYPRVEFYTDSKFSYFYNIKTDTINVANKETGLYVTKVIENSDKITGSYGMAVVSDSKDSSRIVALIITLNNEETIEYDIIEEDTRIVLTKK